MQLAASDLLPVRDDTLEGDLRSWRDVAWRERFPSAVGWLLRGYAVEPPPYVQRDLAALAGASGDVPSDARGAEVVRSTAGEGTGA